MSAHEHWDELAAGYALHGLSADEEATFIDHLGTCTDCVASVNDFEMVGAQLGSMAHYRETEDEAPPWDSIRGAIVASREVGTEVIDLAARRRRYDVSRRALAAAAAVVIVAGGGVVTWQLTTGNSHCSASAGCHTIELDAAGGKTAASVVVRGDTVTMAPTGMRAAPAGQVYVLWQQPRDGRATPISEFRARPGAAPVTARLKAPYADTQQFAVSVESAGAPPATPSNLLASGLAT
jgi:anti-sigma-K factor RskA